MNKDVVKIKA